MASRRTTRRKTARKGTKGKTRAELKNRLTRAQVEVRKLLKGHQAGTLTSVHLRSRLKAIGQHLTVMEPLEK